MILLFGLNGMSKKLDDIYTFFILGICVLGFLLLVSINFIGNVWRKRILQKNNY